MIGYLNYKAHVSRQVYSSDRDAVDETLDDFEDQWPEYKGASNLIDCPSYLQTSSYDFCDADFRLSDTSDSIRQEGEECLKQYLNHDVEELQWMKRHHVHMAPTEELSFRDMSVHV